MQKVSAVLSGACGRMYRNVALDVHVLQALLIAVSSSQIQAACLVCNEASAVVDMI